MDVLIIEPDKLLGETYKKAFTESGLSAEICSGAQEAVNILDDKVPAVIFLELQLGSHNGIEFLYEMRSYKDWQNIPVVINSLIPPDITGMSKANMASLGIDKYFYKPRALLEELVETAKSYRQEK